MVSDDVSYKALIENMISGFAYHKIITDEQGCPIDYEFLEINRAFEELTGLSRQDTIGKRVTEVIPDICKDEFDWIGFYGKIALSGEPDSIEQYSATLDKWYTINAYSTEKGYFVAIFNDITNLKQKELSLINQNEELGQLYEELAATEEELRQQNEQLLENQRIIGEREERLKYLAYHDTLTNLPNRALFMDRLDMACKFARRAGNRCAVLFMDIDNFKRINDSFGHLIGDEMLKQVGNRLSSCIREYDTVARISGDEFAVVFQEIQGEDEILVLAERLKDSFDKPFDMDNISCYASISIGIAVFPDDGNNPVDLLKHSDTALYKAKEHGRNCIQFFNLSMRDDVLQKANIERRLRKAIGSEEFILHYQPQFNTVTGKLCGFEALIRWNSAELGNVNPINFISIAEESGLILPLGKWILQEACKTCKSWKEKYNYNGVLSVNISAVQLKSSDFTDMVKEVLEQTGLSPESLELEITESVLINNYDLTICKLEELKEMGIRVSLDDFGTGYSSLNYLRHLPINALKIDKSYIKNICTDTIEREIVGTIISLVNKLGLESIAEGVESKDQLDYLVQANCNKMQGFLTGKPVPAELVPDFIKRGM